RGHPSRALRKRLAKVTRLIHAAGKRAARVALHACLPQRAHTELSRRGRGGAARRRFGGRGGDLPSTAAAPARSGGPRRTNGSGFSTWQVWSSKLSSVASIRSRSPT